MHLRRPDLPRFVWVDRITTFGVTMDPVESSVRVAATAISTGVITLAISTQPAKHVRRIFTISLTWAGVTNAVSVSAVRQLNAQAFPSSN